MSGSRWVYADLGNSALKLALADGDQDSFPRMHRIALAQADWSDSLLAIFREARWEREERAQWIIASVNRPAFDRLHAWVKRYRGEDRMNVATHRDVPLQGDVESLASLGIDRFIAGWAAFRWNEQRPVVVVDAGSAMTVDLVDAAGVFRGGAIMAGLRMQIRALATGTDALTEFELGDPLQPPLRPGRGTQTAIRLGLCASAAGGVQFLVDQYQRMVSERLRIVVTGGDAAYLQPHLDAVMLPDLILRGLANLASKFESSVQSRV